MKLRPKSVRLSQRFVLWEKFDKYFPPRTTKRWSPFRLFFPGNGLLYVYHFIPHKQSFVSFVTIHISNWRLKKESQTSYVECMWNFLLSLNFISFHCLIKRKSWMKNGRNWTDEWFINVFFIRFSSRGCETSSQWSTFAYRKRTPKSRPSCSHQNVLTRTNVIHQTQEKKEFRLERKSFSYQ